MKIKIICLIILSNLLIINCKEQDNTESSNYTKLTMSSLVSKNHELAEDLKIYLDQKINKNCTIKIVRIINRTSDHIDTTILKNHLKKFLISDKIAILNDEESNKTRADYFLKGTISEFIEKDEQIIVYSLELIDSKNKKIKWINDKNFKKTKGKTITF